LVKFTKTWTFREPSHSNEKSRTYVNTSDPSFTAFPEEGKVDPEACSFLLFISTLVLDHTLFAAIRSDKTAINQLSPGL
jgi:hypothetical protein